MKEIKLTRGYVALVSDEDYERINSYKWCVLTGFHNRAVRRDKNGQIYMHHEVLQVVPKEIKPKEVDHIDGNQLNNCRDNLRIVTHQENMMNQNRVRKGTGVGYYKPYNKWRARWPRMKFIGFFDTQQEALDAVAKAKNASN